MLGVVVVVMPDVAVHLAGVFQVVSDVVVSVARVNVVIDLFLHSEFCGVSCCRYGAVVDVSVVVVAVCVL